MDKILFGKTLNGETTVFGQSESQEISRVYIDAEKQVAPNEFRFTLNRFGNINRTKNSDYQQGIKELFEIP